MAISIESDFHRRSHLLLVFVCIFIISVIAVVISLLVLHKKPEDEYLGKKNILFIVIDDLRPALGCYDNRTITPNIDQLASKGMLFKHAYAQQALGNPSRTSFLTSRRPDSLHVYDDISDWREKDATKTFFTLPEHFKRHGYETISVGKIFVHGSDDYPNSWTEQPYHPLFEEREMDCPLGSINQNLLCPVDVKDVKTLGSLSDVDITQYATDYLKYKMKGNHSQDPFFLAVGYYRPHIPFKFPKEYADLYPIDSMELYPNSTFQPELLSISWNPWVDIREKEDIRNLNVRFPYGPIPDTFQKLIRQGYYSSVSYIDDQVGKLLQALEDTGFAEHTTIVLLGDNGWSLGEHGEWSKYSNYEASVHVPLIVSIPELMEAKSRTPFHYQDVLKYAKNINQTEAKKTSYSPKYTTNELVELVDVFPTLTTIADIPKPPLCRLFSTPFCTEGTSFSQLINHTVNPLSTDFQWKTAVFSQYPRPSIIPQENSDKPSSSEIKYMGYSIRTKRFRYTEWVGFNTTSFQPNRADVRFQELYDHQYDPLELDNVADEGDYDYVTRMLSRMIEKDWRHAMPPGMFDSPRKVPKL